MRDEITLYLTENRALQAAKEYLMSRLSGTGFYRIVPGVARWDDGSMDRGFKVRIESTQGRVIWL
jgi:hypothetical protein